MRTNPINKRKAETLEVFGPRVSFLVPPTDNDKDYCVIQGTIPPGIIIPLHSHREPESFFILSGIGQVLMPVKNELQWINVKPGDMIHIEGNAKHAWRNISDEPMESLVTTSSRLGRFFKEAGRKLKPGLLYPPPSQEELQQFIKTAKRYGHWLASPEENAEFGISLFTEEEAESWK